MFILHAVRFLLIYSTFYLLLVLGIMGVGVTVSRSKEQLLPFWFTCRGSASSAESEV